MIEALVIHKALKKRREKYTDDKNNDNDDDKMSRAQAVFYLIIMIISGVHAYNCYEGVDGRWWRVILATLFPIMYLLLSAFQVTRCGMDNENYVSNNRQSYTKRF